MQSVSLLNIKSCPWILSYGTVFCFPNCEYLFLTKFDICQIVFQLEIPNDKQQQQTTQ